MTISNELRDSNLFRPIKVGNIELNHRVVHAPTTRSRNCPKTYQPTDIIAEYYESRSKYPGSLIIYESCMVSPKSGLVPYKAGLWSDEQCAGFKQITDAIHANGSYVSCQIFGAGRASNIQALKDAGIPYTAPSAEYHSQANKEKAQELEYALTELTVEQIHQLQDDFINAALNCITKCGFDFIELHATSGFLIEQFLSPLSNKRTDKYGGSVSNRCRFLLGILDRCISHPVIGPKKVGVRISAWSSHNGMVYPGYDNEFTDDFPPLEFCKFIMREIEQRKSEGNEIAYISITEARVSGSGDADPTGKTNDVLLPYWSGVLIRTGGYATNYKGDPFAIKSNAMNLRISNGTVQHYEHLLKDVDADDRTLIGFSRPFTSNPDLVHRLEKGLKLNPYDRTYFYSHQVQGYLTYGEYGNDEEIEYIEMSQEESSREGSVLV